MPRQKKQRLKRRKDGRFACRYKDQWFMGATEEEALQAREAYKQAEAFGSRPKTAVTLYEYALKWLPIHKAGVADRTYNDYAAILTRTLRPIGAKLLQDITPDDITAAYADLSGLSASYMAKARILLTAILDSAVESEYIRRNPCRSRSVDIPAGTKGTYPHRSITKEERELIHTVQHRFRPAIILMLYSGLRPEEARAIDARTDIDHEAKLIHVTKVISYAKNQPIISSGKNAFAKRDVILLPIVEEALANVDGLVCRSKTGYMSKQAFRNSWRSYITALENALNGFPAGKRWYGRTKAHKALLASGGQLPPWRSVTFRPYDLRHSFCTMCRDAGIDIHLCMKWMGHSDEKMIMRVYDHITDERIQSSIEKLNQGGFGRQIGRQIENNAAETL